GRALGCRRRGAGASLRSARICRRDPLPRVPQAAARGAPGRESLGAASAGGALAGILAGLLGGLLLRLGDGSESPASLPLSLGLIGALAGGTGAAGIGAGLAFAEAIARSFRGPALVLCGAVAGGLTGPVAPLLVRFTLAGVL